MQELIVDFIISLDGCASAEGWPGWWGLEGPEYLAWLNEQPERDYTMLMGANTYRQMSAFASQAEVSAASFRPDERTAIEQVANAPKVVFSSTLQAPLSLANTRLVRGEAVEAVAAMKRDDTNPMRTVGSVTLCRSLLEAGLVDRFRVVVFPVITGRTGSKRIYDGYPDVALDLIETRTFDGRIQLLEYVPTVLTAPPVTRPASWQVREASVESTATTEIVHRFNRAFLEHDPALLDDIIAPDCVMETIQPAPDGTRYEGYDVNLAFWRAMAADRVTHFEVEDTIVMGDRATIRWRFHVGDGSSVRGVSLIRVRDGRIAEALAYAKTPGESAPLQ